MNAAASSGRLPLTCRTGTACSLHVIGIQLTRWNAPKRYASKFSIAALRFERSRVSLAIILSGTEINSLQNFLNLGCLFTTMIFWILSKS